MEIYSINILNYSLYPTKYNQLSKRTLYTTDLYLIIGVKTSSIFGIISRLKSVLNYFILCITSIKNVLNLYPMLLISFYMS